MLRITRKLAIMATVWLVVGLFSATFPALAGEIDQTLGVDQRVDYKSLVQYGPWDDRNYGLTLEDLQFLGPNEAEIGGAIPAFFRVEWRKHNPQIPKNSPTPYPRSAPEIFKILYGGLMVDGRIQTSPRSENEDRANWGAEIKIDAGAESAIAINPGDPSKVIAGFNTSTPHQRMVYSTDGGITWLFSTDLASSCCDPTVGWSSDGSVAYTASLLNCGFSGCGVAAYRSTDGGQTWSKIQDLTTGGSDKEFLHVDTYPTSPYKDSVYLTWHESNVMQFARMRPGQTSFDPKQTFSSEASGIGSDIATDTAGNVYYVWPGTSTRKIWFKKSTDGGGTWAAGAEIATTQASFDWPIPAMESRRAWIYVAADVDLSGGPYTDSVYVAWTDTTAPDTTTPEDNHTQIHVAYSRDGGATWTEVIPHDTADANEVDRFNQWLDVDANGDVHLVYYSTEAVRPDRTQVDLYYQVSQDGGQTWSTPQRVTSVTSPNISDSFEWGDYNGLDAIGSKILPIWTDNRSGDRLDSIDVYTADGQLCTPPTVDFAISPNPAQAGQTVTFTSTVSGGTPPYTYAWDFDGDSVIDSTDANPIHVYTAYYDGPVRLTVTDSQPCGINVTHQMTVNAPSIRYLSTGTAFEVCGDGDDTVEPGEEWAVPVTVENVGNQDGNSVQADVTVAGAPAGVTLTQGTILFGTVPAAGTATGNFQFLIDAAYTPCGSTEDFDLGTISWTGGSGPGQAGIYTAPIGGGSGLVVRFSDGFEDEATWGGLGYGATDKWAVSTGPGAHTAGEWERTNTGLGGNNSLPDGGSGYWAVADSDTAGSGSQTSTILTSPVIDLSAVTLGPITLDVNLYFKYYSGGGNEHALVEVWDGATWQTVADYSTATVNGDQSYDVTTWAAGNPAFQVRFSYQDAAYDWWFSVDDVQVISPVDPVCDNTVSCGGLIAAFSVPSPVCAGSPVQFTDQSSGAVTWSWDLDGDTVEDSTAQNPTFTYASAGTYSPSLTVTDGGAGTDTATGTVVVIGSTSATPADLDGNALADARDLAAWLAELADGDGTAAADRCQGYATTDQADANADTVIDAADLLAGLALLFQ